MDYVAEVEEVIVGEGERIYAALYRYSVPQKNNKTIPVTYLEVVVAQQKHHML